MADTLTDYLGRWAGDHATRNQVSQTIMALANGCVAIALLVCDGPLAGALGAVRGVENGGGDAQKELDVRTDEMIREALRSAPVAAYASEEADHAELLDASAPLLVAADPLDGSSNIDVGVTIGTIFSVLPAPHGVDPASDEAFLQPCRNQLAAGYVLYGPYTALVLSVGDGTAHFALDRASGEFRLAEARMSVPVFAKEFAINMSNRRHWEDHVRLYIDDLMSGCDGPRETDYNMRWVGSMVADAHRILIRGGIYLYPCDSRQGYRDGRLRLLYEAAPLAMLMENAGGAATDGATPILELTPRSLHQRVPLVFGSVEKVRRVATYANGE